MSEPRYTVYLSGELPDLKDQFDAISMEELNDMDDPAVNFRLSETENVTIWDADIQKIVPTERP